MCACVLLLNSYFWLWRFAFVIGLKWNINFFDCIFPIVSLPISIFSCAAIWWMYKEEESGKKYVEIKKKWIYINNKSLIFNRPDENNVSTINWIVIENGERVKEIQYRSQNEQIELCSNLTVRTHTNISYALRVICLWNFLNDLLSYVDGSLGLLFIFPRSATSWCIEYVEWISMVKTVNFWVICFQTFSNWKKNEAASEWMEMSVCLCLICIMSLCGC